MTKKEIMIKAHKMTKEIKVQYPAIDYKFQLGLCLTYLHEKGEKEMVELKGSEKQIAWAESIRENVIKGLEMAIADYENQRVEKENIGGKYPKRFVRYEVTLKNILEEVRNSDSSKFFIETYSYLSKINLQGCKDYFMMASNNVEF